MPPLEALNAASADAVTGWMLLCCGSPLFAMHMCSLRPFRSLAHYLDCADAAWGALPPEEKACAYAAHPRIGARLPPPRNTEQMWRAGEQAAAQVADPEVKDLLQELNDQYFQKFGFNFLICTSGKSAQELVDAFRSRLKHSKKRELKIAEQEQIKITKIRLEKLLRMDSEGTGPPNRA